MYKQKDIINDYTFSIYLYKKIKILLKIDLNDLKCKYNEELTGLFSSKCLTLHDKTAVVPWYAVTLLILKKKKDSFFLCLNKKILLYNIVQLYLLLK